jgi:hypothetical protein
MNQREYLEIIMPMIENIEELTNKVKNLKERVRILEASQ